MIFFSTIPNSYLAAMKEIETRSNPYPLTEKSLSTSFNKFENLGCFEGNQLISFVLYRVVLDEAEIIHVVSDGDKQKNGYANKLLKKLIGDIGNVQCVSSWYLEVRESNNAARRLYTNLGFKKVGQRKCYYKNREDAILMKFEKI